MSLAMLSTTTASYTVYHITSLAIRPRRGRGRGRPTTPRAGRPRAGPDARAPDRVARPASRVACAPLCACVSVRVSVRVGAGPGRTRRVIQYEIVNCVCLNEEYAHMRLLRNLHVKKNDTDAFQCIIVCLLSSVLASSV